MNRIDRMDEYGIKEVPDLFICDENGEVLYYSIVLKSIKLKQISKSVWNYSINCAIGNIEDWFDVLSNLEYYIFYFKTYKRSRDTGEDKPLCFAINPKISNSHSFSLKPDGEYFTFPINFNFNISNFLWIEDEDCPNYNVWFGKDDNNNDIKEIKFKKPKRNYKEIKVEKVKKRLRELKGQVE